MRALSFRLFPAALLVSLVACGAADDAAPSSETEQDGPLWEDDTTSADQLTQGSRVESLRSVAAEHDVRSLLQDLLPLRGYHAPKLVAPATLAVLRSVKLDGVDARVVVDVTSLQTSVVAAEALDAATEAAADAEGAWLAAHARTRPDAYVKLSETKAPDGATEIALSIDMCQSSRTWNKALYDELSRLGDVLGEPLPVGIAMTGGWARGHAAQLEDLLARGKKNLAIEWVNHSNTHPLHCTDSTQRDCKFLTDPSVSMEDEVLGLEKVLLSQGELVGPLFRFPGLVHNTQRLGELDALGLFALDANAWLAKGQAIVPGSVILVHGNGNEPPGITKIMAWLQDHKSELESGKTRFVSPRYVLGAVPR